MTLAGRANFQTLQLESVATIPTITRAIMDGAWIMDINATPLPSWTKSRRAENNSMFVKLLVLLSIALFLALNQKTEITHELQHQEILSN
jgi:hypothetical protein